MPWLAWPTSGAAAITSEVLARPPVGWLSGLTHAHPHHQRIFRAFGGAAPEAFCVPAVLAAWSGTVGTHLSAAVVQRLTGEVDGPQAELFARRVDSVRRLLDDLDLSELRLALEARVVEMLHVPGPSALRVRAAADFYYSQAARIHYQQHAPVRSLNQVVAGARWRAVQRGRTSEDDLHHAVLEGSGPAGPLFINVLRGKRVRVQAVDLRGDPRTFADAVSDRGAVAAVSGGFFLYSEPDIVPPLQRRHPVGLLRSAGVVVSPPGLRRSCLLMGDTVDIARVGPVGWSVHLGAWSARIEACNDPSLPGVTLFNRAFGDTAPAPGLRIAGTAALGRSAQIDLLGGVVVFPEGNAPDLCGPVVWQPPAGFGFRDAMAGGPLLLGAPPLLDLVHEDFAGSAPPVTFSKDETYDQNLLPRMAAGIDDRGRLVFAGIDGRNFTRAPGFTLAMTAELMRALGCVRAMNLDGGSSKRMVVNGHTVDLSTTEVRGVALQRGPPPSAGGSLTRRVVSALMMWPR